MRLKSTAARGALAGALLGAVLLANNDARATTYTFNVTGDVTAGSTNTFTSGGSDFQTYQLLFPVTPTTINSGDELIIGVALTSGPLVIPAGVNQFFGVNIEGAPPSPDPYPTSAADTTHGTIAFSNLSGPSPDPNASCRNCFSGIIYSSGPSYSFDGLSADLTFTFSDWWSTPVSFDTLSISYQVDNPSPTPLPAALPLLGSGLAGLGLLGWRKKRKMAASAS